MHYPGIHHAIQFTVLDGLARRHLISEKLVAVKSRGLEHPISLRFGSSDIFVYKQVLQIKE